MWIKWIKGENAGKIADVLRSVARELIDAGMAELTDEKATLPDKPKDEKQEPQIIVVPVVEVEKPARPAVLPKRKRKNF